MGYVMLFFGQDPLEGGAQIRTVPRVYSIDLGEREEEKERCLMLEPGHRKAEFTQLYHCIVMSEGGRKEGR